MKGLFRTIVSKADAAKIIRDSAYGFFVVAGLHIVIGIFLLPSVVIDAIIYAVLAAALLIWKSRIAAVLLAILTGIGIGVTIMNFATESVEGGRNVWLAIFMFVTAIRATQASFLFHGKFANEVEGQSDSRVITSSQGQPERKPKK